jgi:signal transduction histidine kinase
MSTRYTILYVDDEPNNLLSFRQAFFRSYHILTATSAHEALMLLAEHPIQLVLTDQRMPVMNGLELLIQVKDSYPDTMRMIVTGYSDLSVVMEAFNQIGIFHYALKPWDNQSLEITIQNALKAFDLKLHNRQLIQQLTQTNASLEARVQQRTEQLLGANQFKDKLLSVVSHDLRSPLGSLASFLELYLLEPDSFTAQETQHMLGKLQQSVSSVSQMLDELLNWSQHQLQQAEPVLDWHPIEPTLNQLLDSYQLAATQKQLKLQTRWPEKPVQVFTDANLLRGIIRNLVSNAIKFTPQGGLITVQVREQAEQFIFSVADSGIGIQSDQVNKLLGGSWLDSTRGTAGEKGTGLGLNLCQDYLARLGSWLQVESRIGEGTRFSFHLPVLDYSPQVKVS